MIKTYSWALFSIQKTVRNRNVGHNCQFFTFSTCFFFRRWSPDSFDALMHLELVWHKGRQEYVLFNRKDVPNKWAYCEKLRPRCFTRSFALFAVRLTLIFFSFAFLSLETFLFDF